MSRTGQEQLIHRMRAAIHVGIWLLVRQSTTKQRDRNLGSAEWQRRQAHHLRAFRVRPEQIHVVDARGESGQQGDHRLQFAKLLAAAQAGRVGILLLARHDRLGRNDEDSAQLFAALKKHGGLILVDGRCYDPRELADKLLLSLHAQFAEYENAARARWLQLTRWALVGKMHFRVALPTGLVWASPDDPAYVAMMQAQGLGEWLERFRENAAAYRAQATVANETNAGKVLASKHRTVYPMPLPDKEVLQACTLRIQWLLETRSVSAVCRRIGPPPASSRDVPVNTTGTSGSSAADVAAEPAHPAWPRPGLVPVLRTGGAQWHPEMKAQWKPVERTALKRWFESPSLFGIYSAHSTLGATIEANEAFEDASARAGGVESPSDWDGDVDGEVDDVDGDSPLTRVAG